MVLPPLVARLVPGIGARLRLPAASFPTRDPAVDLPPVAPTADEKDRTTTRARRPPQTLHPILAVGDAATDGERRGWSGMLGNHWPLTNEEGPEAARENLVDGYRPCALNASSQRR
jgi:hypothetical protein